MNDALTIDEPRRALDETLGGGPRGGRADPRPGRVAQNPSSSAVTACDVDLYVYNARPR